MNKEKEKYVKLKDEKSKMAEQMEEEKETIKEKARKEAFIQGQAKMFCIFQDMGRLRPASIVRELEKRGA